MRVHADRLGLIVGEERKIILCGSLFYFRINKEDWRDRIQQLKYAGYNAIDVYFPWNFHEIEEGVFSFEGQRDIRTFLHIAATLDMYVVARPGPYICSEYDLGGLPGYLLGKDNLILRDNDPEYLMYVKRYFDHILPILSEYQVGKKGSIIALQIENELDFYRSVCTDPKGYIGALYHMTQPYDFDIPIIACAGQGDEEHATGFYPDVLPTFNFYPFSNSLRFEQVAYQKYKELYKRELPLFVTETNRATNQLRRLLYSGVKLLGPYNQVGGTNFGFTNAINNWGDPLTFLTSDYDFGGLIGPKGQTSKDVMESKLFAKFIQTHHRYLAEAIVSDFHFSYTGEATQELNFIMEWPNGAQVYTLSNFEHTTPVEIEWKGTKLPQKATVTLPARVNRFFIHDYPMTDYGLDCIVNYALCELNQIIEDESNVYLICVFHNETEVMIDNVLYVLTDVPITVACGDRQLILQPLSSEKASLLQTIEQGIWIYEDDKSTSISDEGSIEEVCVVPQFAIHKNVLSHKGTACLEDYGVYRGYGYYQYHNVTGIGLYIPQASDIITIYKDGVGQCSTIAANTPVVWLDDTNRTSNFTIKSEIWGHTNFHDNRLPSLEMNAKRGLNKVYSIVQKIPYHDGMVVDQDCILYSTQNADTEVQINQGSYHFNKFNQVISLENVYNQPLYITYEGDVDFTIFSIQELPLSKLEVVHEDNLIDSVKEATCSTRKILPLELSLGDEVLLNLSIENPLRLNQYLTIEAESCQLTCIFKDEIVGRLLFIESNLFKMTGGSKNTVYLPGKWFEQTNEIIHIMVESLGKSKLKSIDLHSVNGTHWDENIKK